MIAQSAEWRPLAPEMSVRVAAHELRETIVDAARVIRAMDELGIDTAELRRSRQYALDTLAVLT